LKDPEQRTELAVKAIFGRPEGAFAPLELFVAEKFAPPPLGKAQSQLEERKSRISISSHTSTTFLNYFTPAGRYKTKQNRYRRTL
jgi:hypothetical protein